MSLSEWVKYDLLGLPKVKEEPKKVVEEKPVYKIRLELSSKNKGVIFKDTWINKKYPTFVLAKQDKDKLVKLIKNRNAQIDFHDLIFTNSTDLVFDIWIEKRTGLFWNPVYKE